MLIYPREFVFVVSFKMDTVGFNIDSSEYKLSKINILRGLITDKMTTAVREILAVVETTVVGYENEVSMLKRELNHRKKQLDAILQPQVSLYKTGLVDDALCHVSMGEHSQCIASKTLEHKNTENNDHPTPKISTSKNEEADRVPSNAQVSQQEVESSEDEDGCTFEDLPSDSSESCPSHNEGSHSRDKINEVPSARSSDRKIKRRYRSQRTDNSEKDWEPHQNNKKRRVIKLQIGVLKCSDTELSHNAFGLTPVQTIMCQQNLSETDFLKELSSAFPELREDKPFEAFLPNRTKRSPVLVNGMTSAALYKAFTSTRKRKFDFYIQLKDHKDICDTQTNTPASHDDNEPGTSCCDSPVDQLSETGEICQSTDEADSMSSADSATEEDEEDEEEQDCDKNQNRKSEQNPNGAAKSQECQVCGMSFKSRAVLTKHAVGHVGDPEGLCGVCGQHVQPTEELRCHLNTHKKLFECHLCGRLFTSKPGFQNHFINHKTEKPFKCQICPKAFIFEDDMKRHESEHEVKPYKCDTCHKCFCSQNYLDNHSQIHTGKKQFGCDVCGKLLSDFYTFLRHKQTHSGHRKRDYSCKYCGKLFLRLEHQKNHERIHTTREKNFLCDICSKSFHTKEQLKGHLDRHDDKHIQICPVCGKPIKGGLRRHMMIHTGEKPLSCTECDMKFLKTSHLKYHLLSHTGIKAFPCKVCGKSYGRNEHLKVHMRSHTGEKPYKCTLCDKAFTQGHCLKTHTKSHLSYTS